MPKTKIIPVKAIEAIPAAGLVPKQKAFCEEYIVDLNATQACIRAGYSANLANVKGAQLMAIPKVQAYIAHLMSERSTRTQITADMVLQELAKLAFSNMRDYAEFGESGIRFKESSQLTPEQLAAVAEVEEKTGNTNSFRLKLHDKLSALDKLARHLGLYEQDNRQQAPSLNARTVNIYAGKPNGSPEPEH
jgi:phage terminase small subunit